MSTLQELEQFHEFATNLLSQTQSEYTLEELLDLYRAAFELSESNAAIEESLHDLAAGKARPLKEFLDEFRQRHQIPAADPQDG